MCNCQDDADYLGCWKDSTSQRAVRYRQDKNKQPYTPLECKVACSPDYVFYASQFYGECWCDNDFLHVTQFGKAIDCPINGGSYTFQLYFTNDVVSNSDHLGCWRDKSDKIGRASRYRITGNEPYDKSSCKSECPYAYYALQFHGECWCDWDLSRAIMYGKADNCPSDMLGGSWTFELYYRGPLPSVIWHSTISGEASGRDLEISCETNIAIVAARYGVNCGSYDNSDQTSNLKIACQNAGKECTYTIDKNVIGDPAPACVKEYFYAWQCW